MLVPGYEFHNVGSLVNDPKIDVVHGLIYHVTGTNVSPLHYFDGPSQGIESTFYIPKTSEDPKEQYRDTNREADANYKANSWIGTDGLRHGFLSVETQGLGGGKWTKYQLDSLKDLTLVTAKEHGYPLKECESYHGHGVGYHTMYPQWTNVSGKTCPGAERIIQFREIIVPWLAEQRTASKYYVTKVGDTAPSVADKFHIKVVELWRWNDGVSLPLKPGTRLRIKL
jgi:LysM repeat protein